MYGNLLFKMINNETKNTQLFDKKKCINEKKSDNVITISNNSNKNKRKISCFLYAVNGENKNRFMIHYYK